MKESGATAFAKSLACPALQLGLPKPEELVPLDQPLLTPMLAEAFMLADSGILMYPTPTTHSLDTSAPRAPQPASLLPPAGGLGTGPLSHGVGVAPPASSPHAAAATAQTHQAQVQAQAAALTAALAQHHALSQAPLAQHHSISQSALAQHHALSPALLAQLHAQPQAALAQHHPLPQASLAQHHALSSTSLAQHYSPPLSSAHPSPVPGAAAATLHTRPSLPVPSTGTAALLPSGSGPLQGHGHAAPTLAQIAGMAQLSPEQIAALSAAAASAGYPAGVLAPGSSSSHMESSDASNKRHHPLQGGGGANAAAGTSTWAEPKASNSPGEVAGSGGDEGGPPSSKRPRLVWTPQLHKRFVDAVSHLGINVAGPKTIMQMMNVEGLTRENVASHLQKYRLYLNRLREGAGGVNGAVKGFEGMEPPPGSGY